MRYVFPDYPNHSAPTESVNSVLSFQPFYRYLQQKSASERTVKVELYNRLIEKIDAYPALKKPVKPKELGKYVDLFELIYAYLTGITTEETETMWGLGTPRPGPIFYGTDNVCSLLVEHGHLSIEKNIDQYESEMARRERSFIYSLIMERCYNFNPLTLSEMIHYMIDEKTGLWKYYRVNVDTRFIEITCREKLPELDFREVEEHVYKNTLLEYLVRALPMHHFTFTGFNVVYLTQFTEQYAIQSIKNLLLEHSGKSKEQRMSELAQVLKTLAGCKDVDFGFIPFVRLNESLVLDFYTISSSILLYYHKRVGGADTTVQALLETFIENPRPVFLINQDLETESEALHTILQDADLRAYALLPLFFNGNLTGALEVYAKKEDVVNKKLLSNIDPALPHIAQSMKVAIDDFYQKISRTVNDKFTSLQPSVQWRFNEAAWNYLYKSLLLKREDEIEPIVFDRLYPLYGAIDIRNSSVERNNAVAEDLRYQLGRLAETMAGLKNIFPMAVLDKMVSECEKWLHCLSADLPTEEEIRLNYFLEKEALPALMHFQELRSDAAAIVGPYIAALNEATGKAHENRRNLEISTQMITKTLDGYFNSIEEDLQKAYPFYFEKYRTDGVEYDIFIGQSLAPYKPFDPIYLNNLRLWQVQSMAYLCHEIRSLQTQMPKTLQVTMLIYINSDSIEIRFRNDEKRFDVEGGYNVRYQMIKKRIDKVHLRETNERLTQPDKIALVYSNRQDADEYISHIRYLQGQGILLDDLEYLELEELQGVSGLKALRVGVRT